MLGEVTMVQFYSVALTAGKAHRDHKHHHAHKYDHNGTPITTTPPPIPAPRPTQPTHPLLTGGQINPDVALNIAAQQPLLQLIPGQDYNSQLISGQYIVQQPQAQNGPSQLSPQVFTPSQPTPQQQQPQQALIQINPGNSVNDIGSYSQQRINLGGRPLVNSGLVHSSLVNPANVQFIEGPQLETHQLYKRQSETDSKHNKRELFLSGGQLVQDSLLGNSYDQTLLDGLAGIGENEPVLLKQKQSDEREPAEAEVKAVMSICTGCDPEPFGKAIVFAWRTVAKKLYSGAFYQPAVPECRVF